MIFIKTVMKPNERNICQRENGTGKENIHLNQSPETPLAMLDISIYIDPVRLSEFEPNISFYRRRSSPCISLETENTSLFLLFQPEGQSKRLVRGMFTHSSMAIFHIAIETHTEELGLLGPNEFQICNRPWLLFLRWAPF